MVVPAGVDFDSVVASDRRSWIGACYENSERTEPRRTRQTGAIVAHRLLTFAAGEDLQRCDLACGGGRL